MLSTRQYGRFDRPRWSFFLLLALLAGTLATSAWAQESEDEAGTETDAETQPEDLGADSSEVDMAQESDSVSGADRPWHLGVEVLTDVPLLVGGRVATTGVYGLRFSVTLGVLPDPYLDLINETATALDWYNEATAALIKTALSRSLLTRFHVGWQPVVDLGFYVDVGYTLATLGGGTSREEFITEATGQPPPEDGPPKLENEYLIDSTLHMLDIEIGWEWLLAEVWTLRVALGFAGTVGSSTTVTANYDVPPPLERPTQLFEQGTATYLDDVYASYVHTAVVTFAFGYRFF